MFQKLKKPIIFIPLAIVIIIIIISVVRFQNKQPEYDSMTVSRGSILQEVSVTGKVKAAEEVNLAFERSGKISSINVDVGDIVKEGQVLAMQNSAEAGAQVAQANARLESARANVMQYKAALDAQIAKLDEIKKGTRLEEVAVQEMKVLNAEKTLSDAKLTLSTTRDEADTKINNLYNGVLSVLTDAYARSNEAIRQRMINMFNTNGDKFVLSYTSCDQQAGTDAAWLRYVSEEELNKWSSEIALITGSTSRTDLDLFLDKAQSHVSIFNQFLNRTSDTLTNGCSIDNTTLTSYRTNLSTAQGSISSALTLVSNRDQDIAAQKSSNQTNINTAEKGVNDAEYNLSFAKKELELKKAGSTPEAIRAQEASVDQARANLMSQDAMVRQEQANIQSYQAQLAKTAIVSPFAGVVTKQDGKLGSIVAANEVIISLISEAKFEIEANVPEADIAKLEIGDLARITLDAYGDDVVFDAKIVEIDPAETIIDGVSTYRVVLQFVNEDGRIKSGMTANIDIETEKKEGVLAIPQRSLIIKDGGKFIRILQYENSKENIVEIPVTTGIRGSDGTIEIIEGLKEGEKIITSIGNGTDK